MNVFGRCAKRTVYCAAVAMLLATLVVLETKRDAYAYSCAGTVCTCSGQNDCNRMTAGGCKSGTTTCNNKNQCQCTKRTSKGPTKLKSK
jgi:hypothetical protein